MENEQYKSKLGGMTIASDPTWANPNVGMIALMASSYHAYGDQALEDMRAAFRKLGHKSGEAALANGWLTRDCSPTEWGRYTHQLMDLTGMYAYEELTATDTLYEFQVRSENWPYHEPMEYFDAPHDICDIPADWDRGMLDVINPKMVMTQPKCSARGDEMCLWRYELT